MYFDNKVMFNENYPKHVLTTTITASVHRVVEMSLRENTQTNMWVLSGRTTKVLFNLKTWFIFGITFFRIFFPWRKKKFFYQRLPPPLPLSGQTTKNAYFCVVLPLPFLPKSIHCCFRLLLDEMKWDFLIKNKKNKNMLNHYLYAKLPSQI